MSASTETTCSAYSKGLMYTGLGVLALSIVCMPVIAILWPIGVALAATGIMLRILGVQQISLAGWLGLIILLSIAALIGLSALHSDVRGWRAIALPALLPALVIWVLGTFATWLFVVDALRVTDQHQRMFYFAHCMLAPPAMLGLGITFVGVVIGLLGSLLDPLGHRAGGLILTAFICGWIGGLICWPISKSYCDLIRSARMAVRSPRQQPWVSC